MNYCNKLSTAIALLIAGFSSIIYAQPGMLDPSFNGTGKVTTNIGQSGDKANAIAVQPDGKILVGGTSMCQAVREGFSLIRLNTDGTLDNTFGNNGITATLIGNNVGGIDDIIQAIALQPDGKILVTGRSMGSSAKVIRYNSNGSADTQFGLNGMADAPRIDWPYAIQLQQDGKIIIAGETRDTVTSASAFGVVRLNANGTPDNTFDGDGLAQTSIGNDYYSEVPRAAALQDDGKIVVAGFSNNGVSNVFVVVRYNTDGSLDNSLDTNGIITTSIGPGSHQANAVVIQDDGKIIAGGYAASSNYFFNFALIRYNPDGSLDSTFSDDGIDTTNIGPYSDIVYALSLQPDGKIVAAGSAEDFFTPFTVARYNTDGSLDASFSSDGILPVSFGLTRAYCLAMALTPDGKIALSGFSTPDASTFHYAVARCTSDGNVDNTFSDDGITELDLELGSDKIADIIIRPDGKILTAGQVNFGNGVGGGFAQYTASGSLDPTFGVNGIKQFNQAGIATCIALQNDGKILVGYDIGFGIMRFNADGMVDSTFGTDGYTWANYFYTNYGNTGAYAVAIQPDGKIILGGYTDDNIYYAQDFAIARFKTNGEPDSTFGTNGKVATDLFTYGTDKIYALALQPDGKIVAAGSAGTLFGLTRYNPDGTLDNSFGNNGIVTTLIGSQWSDIAKAVTIQPDGKIIVAGTSQTGTNQNYAQYSFAVVRYLTNGSLDAGFGNNGKVIDDFGNSWNDATSVAVQPDGKIIASGSTGINNYSAIGQSDFALLRLNNDGSLDNNFGTNGRVITDFSSGDDQSGSMALQSDGAIVLAGYASGSFDTDFALARYSPGITPGFSNPEQKENTVLLYPNPASNLLTVKTAISKGFYTLNDITGNTVLLGSVNNTNFSLSLSTLSSGVYFISVTDGNKEVRGKVVKQ